MIKPGLVSVTFRDLTADEIIEASVKAGIRGIEWGGDIHVPHGDIAAAEEVGAKTREAGLEVASYGSYYAFDSDKTTFEKVLATALALGAPLIRVWAGRKGPEKVSTAEFNRIVDEARIAGDLCRTAGVDLAFEYHRNSLTETGESARSFMQSINHPSVFCYWQPPVGMAREDCLHGLEGIKEYLKWVHVFYWEVNSGVGVKHLLEDGDAAWREYIEKISTFPGDRWLLLEFVKDNKLESFYKDAAALIRLVGG